MRMCKLHEKLSSIIHIIPILSYLKKFNILKIEFYFFIVIGRNEYVSFLKNMLIVTNYPIYINKGKRCGLKKDCHIKNEYGK